MPTTTLRLPGKPEPVVVATAADPDSTRPKAGQLALDDTREICAEPARHCDHIVPASEGGSDDPSNLRALCDWHVLRKDAADAGRARKRAAAMRWQPAQTHRPHPGEVR
ncbi:HNH endonuclease [Kitasatospora sp. NPDC048407]|uniref:HNH endonuclease n=1 Tax=Kitasatospora sp. NPDC048407 TaxID=3364051 RepID=UPI00371E174F